jgi:hypothetical protein
MSKLALRAQTVDIAYLPLRQDFLAKNVLMTAQRDLVLGNSLQRSGSWNQCCEPGLSIRDPGRGEVRLHTIVVRHLTSLWQASLRSEWETGGKSGHLQMKLPAAPQAGSSLCSDKLQGILVKANNYVAPPRYFQFGNRLKT